MHEIRPARDDCGRPDREGRETSRLSPAKTRVQCRPAAGSDSCPLVCGLSPSCWLKITPWFAKDCGRSCSPCPAWRSIGEATNGRDAVDLAARLRPSVIVMDVAMPLLNGCEAARQILLADPSARVLALSARSDDEQVARMIAAGALGFVDKHRSGDMLLHAIRAVGDGRTSQPRHHPPPAPDRPPGPRGGARRPRPGGPDAAEEEILQRVAEGAPNKQIAAELGISAKTVDKHRQQLMANWTSTTRPPDPLRHPVGTIECTL